MRILFDHGTPIGIRSSKRLKPMTPEAIESSASADRDAEPLTAGDLKRMRRTPQAKIIRRALALKQEEFAARYDIPLGTLRDWEQGRAQPDRPTQAYLKIIACEPARRAVVESEGLGSGNYSHVLWKYREPWFC
jgi:putative transcriptional regulator